VSGHVVLLGDSIFDNAAYVPGGPSVLEHLRRMLPRDWRATLLAVDGAVVASVYSQLERLPKDATHLVLSAGGNNALWTGGSLFGLEATSVREALAQIAAAVRGFAAEYGDLVAQLTAFGKPLTVCTIYDAIPELGPAEIAGLCLFNDVITRTAFAAGATLIDLRIICRETTDYAAVSPIEPSVAGGGKIARAVVDAVLGDAESSRVIV
jgi:hypothetical protein